MPTMIEEYHVTINVRKGLPYQQCVSMRRVLNSRRFQSDLRQAVLAVVKRHPLLAAARVAISR